MTKQIVTGQGGPKKKNVDILSFKQTICRKGRDKDVREKNLTLCSVEGIFKIGIIALSGILELTL